MKPGLFSQPHMRRLALILGTLFVLVHGYGLVLKFMPPPVTILMKQRQLAGETLHYKWVPLEDISPYLAYAVIGAEDSRFCSHHGIDWKAIEKVLDEREAGKSRRGGSSITQQTAEKYLSLERRRMGSQSARNLARALSGCDLEQTAHYGSLFEYCRMGRRQFRRRSRGAGPVW